ncbi:MAG TPA: hypothetical protein H9823_07660 [Candidatus Rubneribacter avistercoris]|nr:hypothetical protein [Candidatus Rubneribacter avistercoris]
MDKEEVLEKSRCENRFADERMHALDQRAGYLMVRVMLVVWLALFVWDLAHGQDAGVGGTIMLSGTATMCFFRFRQTDDPRMRACGVLAALGAACFAAQHIMATM